MRNIKNKAWSIKVSDILDCETKEHAGEIGYRLPEYIRMAVEILNKRMKQGQEERTSSFR